MFLNSAMYSLEKSVPSDGCFISGATAVVRNTFPFHTIGDDQPMPGISATHSTFSVADQVFGSLGLSLTGSAPGPRNCGQLTGDEDAAPVSAAPGGRFGRADRRRNERCADRGGDEQRG